MHVLLFAVLCAAPQPLRLADLLKEARAKNHDVRAAELRSQAAAAQVPASSALEDPMLMVQLWNAPANFSTVPIMVQLTQPIPLGGKREARRQRAEAELRAASAGAATQLRDTEAEVARAYFDLYLAERTETVDAEIEKTLQELRGAALARIEAGIGQPVEALKLQGALLELSTQREVARQQATSARLRLAALLARPREELLGPVTEPSLLPGVPEPPQLLELAERNRPELAAAQARVSSAEQELRLARAEAIPDLGVFAAEMHAFRAPGEADFLFAGVQLNLPLFSVTKTQPRISAARLQAEALRESEWALQDRIAAEVAETRTRLRSEESLVTSHHQLIQIARQALESAAASYATGRSDLLTALDSVRELQSHELDLAMHLAAYEQRLAELEHAVGAELGLVEAAEGGSHAHP